MNEIELLALAAAAAKRKRQPNTNPGVTPDAPPDTIYNPNTGQFTSRELLANAMGQAGPATTAAGATIMGAGRGATLGAIDELTGLVSAAIPGRGTAAERGTFGREFVRAAEDAARANNPDDMLTSEIAGAVAIPIAAPFQAAGRLPRIGGSMAAGGLLGAIYGAFTGEGGLSDRAADAQRGGLVGAGAGGLASIAGSGIQKVLDGVVQRRAIARAARNAPTSEALRRMGNEAYDEVDRAGVQIRGDAFDRARLGILGNLRSSTAYSPRPGAQRLVPNTSAVVGDMAEIADELRAAGPTAGLPFEELDGLRRQAGAAAGNIQVPADRKAGMTIIEGLDDFIQNLGPDDVLAGDVGALQTAIPKARDIWARMSKSQRLDDAMERSTNYLSGGASGLRNQFKNILQNPKLRRGFTEAELAAMRRVAQGTVPEQLLYMASGGIGNLMSMGGGFAMGGFPGFLAGTAGAAAMRNAAQAVAMRNAEIARGLVANGRLVNLPVASQTPRGIIETLIRRGGAVSPQ